ncbi:flavin-containing monooxygenase [Flocculibacter collagenilyticus]|uniref:flavin-containing monooxygenase n=1 Tax=Flocculibacter collagenilyticus TaxID=2744479 RepID=UPI0018F75633|nr:NAD(P)/FAD-dependent oxidoreductase [Flocculibacter collagenilyticus]
MKYDYIIIGAGQAGLAMAYHLKQMNANFMMLDAASEIGAAWLKRWDSLTLFTPTEFNHLPGMQFPAADGHYPDKHDVAKYFKQYVRHYDLPITLNTKVHRLQKDQDGFTLSCESYADASSSDEAITYQADRVIVATGPFHTPFIPPCHSNIDESVVQLHSKDYRNPNQLAAGDTLVVGAGDSGFQILHEISDAKPNDNIYFSGKTDCHSIPQQFLGKTLWWWFDKLGVLSVTKYSWLGKQLSKRMQPVIGTNVKALLAKQNITCVGKTLDANLSEIQFEKANIAGIKNIVWATGYRPDFTWLKDIELDGEGYPANYRGVSTTEGLYFIGLPWMYTRGSATLGGVQKDADYLQQVLLNKPAPSPAINCELTATTVKT